MLQASPVGAKRKNAHLYRNPVLWLVAMVSYPAGYCFSMPFQQGLVLMDV